MNATQSEGSRTTRLSSALCWVALALFAASLALPALRVQGRGEWVAGEPGFQCAFLSLAEFPCWVPNALVIATPLIAILAGKPVQKAFGVVLGLTTLTVLDVCVPGLALTHFRQGPLPGFWLWAAALVTATASLLLGGFSPVHPSVPGPRSAGVSPRGRARPRGAIVLCWLAFAVFVLARLAGLRSLMDGSFPQGLSRGISVFVFHEVVIPALLAMAPLACLYADDRARRFMALAIGLLGLLPFLSIDGPVQQPVGGLAPLQIQPGMAGPQSFEALAPRLLSSLTEALAAAGLLVSAGLVKRTRNARAGHAAPGGAELPGQQIGSPEASPAATRGNPPLGAALCWLALAHSLGLGSLASHFEGIGQWASMPVWWLIFSQRTLTSSLLAMAPWVCRFSGPAGRRILGTSLALIALMMMLRGEVWFKSHPLPDLIALCPSAVGLFLADIVARQRAE